MDLYKHRVDLEYFGFLPNNEYDWCPGDIELLYNGNRKKFPSNKSLDYYAENPIKYKFNNCGFRTPDNFNSTDEGNVFLGCSHTFGIGHHLENTWGWKLNELIGGKFFNLAIGGTGVMTHYRILKGFYKELNIKNVFHYAPLYNRYEFIVNHTPTSFIMGNLAAYHTEWQILFGDLLRDSLTNNDQTKFIYNSYIDAIRGLCYELGINYYLITDVDSVNNIDGSLQARDLHHYTVNYQNTIYENFVKLYDTDLYKNIVKKNII